MSLMLYNPPPILSRLYAAERTFNFADRDIKIRQDWTRHGVAAVVWDAAVVLAMYFDALPATERNGKRILEIGAGTGLAGIVACLLGFHTTFTDRLAVLNQTLDNVERNVEDSTKYSVVELDWGKQLELWKDKEFDTIIGADVIYVEESFPLLLETLLTLTEGRKHTTKLLLSCRIRYEKDNKFIELLRDYFDIKVIRYDKTYDVRLYEAIRRKESEKPGV